MDATPETLPFPCENCGACCKSLNGQPNYDYLNKGDGVCRFYNDALKKCDIYKNRPEDCNMEKYYYKEYKDKMSWNEYVILCKKGCQELRNKLNIK